MPRPRPHPLPADAPLRRGRLLLGTSGSLGPPKLVVHTHEGLLANARNAVERLGLRASDRVLLPVPLAHMYGLGAGFLPALLAGASVQLCEGTNLLRYLEHERSFRPTIAYLTPNLCAMLLRPRSTTADYRHIMVAGDKLTPEVSAQAQRIYGRVLVLYGSTELGVVCAMDADAPAPSTTVGRALPGVRLRLAPPADGAAPAAASEQVPAADCGELWCAHPFGFEGYVNEEGEPLPTGVESGWCPTRDLARIDGDGFVELLGRVDHAIKRDGRLVMLAEVERALCQLPQVERAAVVAFGETLRGKAMIAFVTRRSADQAPGPASELLKRCAELLPPYAIPDEVRWLDELPTLASGKLDRQRLASLAAAPKTTDPLLAPVAKVQVLHGSVPDSG